MKYKKLIRWTNEHSMKSLSVRKIELLVRGEKGSIIFYELVTLEIKTMLCRISKVRFSAQFLKLSACSLIYIYL